MGNKEQNAASFRKWYASNKEVQAARITLVRRRYYKWIDSLKDNKVCISCGEDDKVCLDWHHRDPSTKSFTLAWAKSNNVARQKVLDEIAKCDLLCANCHRKGHAYSRS